MADEKNCATFSDRGTALQFQSNIDLKRTEFSDSIVDNPYAYLVIQPGNATAAHTFESYLLNEGRRFSLQTTPSTATTHFSWIRRVPLALQQGSCERVVVIQSPPGMEHHGSVSHVVCLRNVVHYHHNASTPISQPHQLFFDGLNVEPTGGWRCIIEEQERRRKGELSSEHQTLPLTAGQIQRGLFSHLAQLEYITVALATRR